MKKIAILSLFILASSVGYSQVEKIKALMLFNIASMSKFDASKSSGDFVIGVKDNPKMLSAFNNLAATKKVAGRTIVVKKISSGSDAASCAVVYVSSNDAGSFKSACESGKTMLYSDNSGTCKKGAGVSFYINGGKPAFEISASNLKACGITAGSKILAMGTKI